MVVRLVMLRKVRALLAEWVHRSRLAFLQAAMYRLALGLVVSFDQAYTVSFGGASAKAVLFGYRAAAPPSTIAATGTRYNTLSCIMFKLPWTTYQPQGVSNGHAPVQQGYGASIEKRWARAESEV